MTKEQEQRFDERFVCKGCTIPHEPMLENTSIDDIKSFISQLIQEAKEDNLSNLIAACGKGLQSLINDNENGWIAFTNKKDDKGDRMEIKGQIPEDAVKNLLQALNQPKQ